MTDQAKHSAPVELTTRTGTYEVDSFTVKRLPLLMQSYVRDTAAERGDCPCALGILGPQGCVCERLTIADLLGDPDELANAWWRVARDLGYTAGGNRWAPV